MKRILLSAAAALSAIVPLGGTAYARDNDRDRGEWRDHDNGRHERWDRHGDHDGRRDWDDRRHNGYYYGGRWYFGPPPLAFRDRYDFRPDYHPWRAGDFVPPYYRGRFEEVDYRWARLRPPPRGCHYVRDDRGDILLAAVATGLIISVIAHH